jgi:hypothetical protein
MTDQTDLTDQPVPTSSVAGSSRAQVVVIGEEDCEAIIFALERTEALADGVPTLARTMSAVRDLVAQYRRPGTQLRSSKNGDPPEWTQAEDPEEGGAHGTPE